MFCAVKKPLFPVRTDLQRSFTLSNEGKGQDIIKAFCKCTFEMPSSTAQSHFMLFCLFTQTQCYHSTSLFQIIQDCEILFFCTTLLIPWRRDLSFLLYLPSFTAEVKEKEQHPRISIWASVSYSRTRQQGADVCWVIRGVP